MCQPFDSFNATYKLSTISILTYSDHFYTKPSKKTHPHFRAVQAPRDPWPGRLSLWAGQLCIPGLYCHRSQDLHGSRGDVAHAVRQLSQCPHDVWEGRVLPLARRPPQSRRMRVGDRETARIHNNGEGTQCLDPWLLRQVPSIWCLQMTLWIHKLYRFSPSLLQSRRAMESEGSWGFPKEASRRKVADVFVWRDR